MSNSTFPVNTKRRNNVVGTEWRHGDVKKTLFVYWDYKWHTSPPNTYGNNLDRYQPVHPHSRIRAFPFHQKNPVFIYALLIEQQRCWSDCA